MKKLLAILLGACLLLGVMTGCGGNAEDAVTVQKVSDITSQGSVGLVNRYAGIVVSGETATVKKGDKKVLETYVKEGDFVTEGDVLFCYDNEAMELQLSKLLLELEGYENTISNAEEDIPNLERQRRLHHHHGHDDLSGQGHDQRAERRHAFRGDERAYPFTP